MKYNISDDRKRLTITASHSERLELSLRGEEIQSDKLLRDFLEPMVCNSELEWIDPADTGDLTSAPMLGIREGRIADEECRPAEVLDRWAFMEYQVQSVLEVLRDKGEVIFIGGPL